MDSYGYADGDDDDEIETTTMKDIIEMEKLSLKKFATISVSKIMRNLHSLDDSSLNMSYKYSTIGISLEDNPPFHSNLIFTEMSLAEIITTSEEFCSNITSLTVIIGLRDVYENLFYLLLIMSDKLKLLKSFGLLLPLYAEDDKLFISTVLNQINGYKRKDWIFFKSVMIAAVGITAYRRRVLVFHHVSNIQKAKDEMLEIYKNDDKGVDKILQKSINEGSELHKHMCREFNPPSGSHSVKTSKIFNLFKALAMYPHQVMIPGHHQLYLDQGCGDPRLGYAASIVLNSKDHAVLLTDIEDVLLLNIQNQSIRCDYIQELKGNQFALQESRFQSSTNSWQVCDN